MYYLAAAAAARASDRSTMIDEDCPDDVLV